VLDMLVGLVFAVAVTLVFVVVAVAGFTLARWWVEGR